MSLWEYGAIMHGWQERQPKDDSPAPDLDPDDMPDEEAWAQASVRTARVVRQIEQREAGT